MSQNAMGQALMVAAVVGFVAIPAVASAHGGNDDPNAVHACINNSSLAVRVVGLLGSCTSAPASKAETPGHWAIQGPPGTDGTNGTNGFDGTSVTLVGYFSGNQNGCVNGGAIFAAGGVNAYVCNGTGGASAEADGRCWSNHQRYVDCGNGTVTDQVTGLIWLQDASCLGSADYAGANVAAAQLASGICGLTDNSVAGQWRLPTKEDWVATTARAVALDCFQPGLTANDGATCYSEASDGAAANQRALLNVAMGFSGYWSSTMFDVIVIDESQPLPPSVWGVDMSSGGVTPSAQTTDSVLRVWPVRGGPR